MPAPDRPGTSTVPVDAVLDLAVLDARVDAAVDGFRSADPFPHGVFDDLLRPEAFAACVAELHGRSLDGWTSYVHVNERKFGHSGRESWGPWLTAVADALTSRRVVDALERLTGIDALLADPDLDGGGVHRSTTGGYLNIHADFTAHHTRPTWRRRVNLILYLNEDWQDSYGGALELWDRDMAEARSTIQPVGNRAVVFETSEHSFHGHPEPLATPPDIDRWSLALYYFTEAGRPLVRATNYRPRPGDGARRLPILLDGQLVRAYDALKRRTGLSDALVSRILGRGQSGRRRGGPDGTPR